VVQFLSVGDERSSGASDSVTDSKEASRTVNVDISSIDDISDDEIPF